ncbi:cell division protein ZapA [Bacillaceae bacterium]
MGEEEKINRLTVEIYGQQYKIVGKASISHMRAVAGYVDDKMRHIAETNPRLDTMKLAVLSAVNIADEYFRLKKEYEDLLHILEENGLVNDTAKDKQKDTSRGQG